MANHHFTLSGDIDKDERSTEERIFSLYRNGFRFERSGDSMAVFVPFDGSEMPIDRVTFPCPSGRSNEASFFAAIDAWLLARYMREVA